MALTFGAKIAEQRKNLGFSQKDLASKILKEDGTHISPQYLNDIERNRRTPGGFVIKQFAQVLQLNEDTLYYLADQIPMDIRGADDYDKIAAGFRAFRQTLEKK